jgi:hypothetical protein
MKTSRALVLAITLSTMTFATAKETPKKPSLDGVWLSVSVTNASLGPGWQMDKLTDTAKHAMAEFQKSYPNAPEAGTYCVHSGLIGMMTSSAGYPIEIISNPKQINITVETGSMRRIFLDGRKHPDDRPPTSTGHSVAHWDGDVLVIETVGMLEQVASRPTSDQARITERLYLVKDKGETRAGIAEKMGVEHSGMMLVDEITLDDPKFYSAPMKYLANYRRASDESVLEYDCGREFYDVALQEIANKQSKHD